MIIRRQGAAAGERDGAQDDAEAAGEHPPEPSGGEVPEGPEGQQGVRGADWGVPCGGGVPQIGGLLGCGGG